MKPMKPIEPMKPMAPMEPMRTPAANWWPNGLDHPASSGEQDGLRYAFFPRQRRLAIERTGKVEVYDTGDHAISGVSQQQDGRATSPRFTSQHGEVDLSTLSPLSSQTCGVRPDGTCHEPECQ
jgi:hypothetical protein